ncbi:hypothetical protein FB639_000141 [Coemansia asiatica]|nr:hypothetical protein FB639_000141 [Coemansia asiatica]
MSLLSSIAAKRSFQHAAAAAACVQRCFATSTTTAASSSAQARIPAVLEERIAQRLDEMKSAGTFKTERIITTPQNSSISVQSSTKPVLNFCANNYLGLADHPLVVERASRFLNTWGNGLSSVRFICGTQTIHKDLENQITAFYNRQDTGDTILYASCFDANAGIFESLLTDQDAIISDSLNHASIIDGVRLCKAKRFRYANGDVHDLDRQLQLAADAG